MRTQPHTHSLACAIWNINGLTDKREFIHEIITELDIDLLFLSETKRSTTVDMNTELAIESREYRVIQLFSMEHHRGGLVLILRRSFRLETARILKVRDGENLIQGMVQEEREGKELVFWHCAPPVENKMFVETLKVLLKEHNVQFLASYFNARHPTWYRKHEDKKRGTLLIETPRNMPGYRIFAPRTPLSKQNTTDTEIMTVSARSTWLWLKQSLRTSKGWREKSLKGRTITRYYFELKFR